jgi:hypothetical protein
MRRAVVLLLAVVTVALPLSKSYDVVPYADYIGTAPGWSQYGVSQYYRNTLDSITMVSFWVGDTIDTTRFNIRVVDSVIPTHRVAHKEGVKATQCWYWMNVPLLPDPVYKPVRGRTYKVEVTRPTTGATISYAYDPRETKPV